MQPFEADILIQNKRGSSVFLIMTFVFGGILVALALLGFAEAIFHVIGLLGFIVSSSKYYLQTRKQVLKKAVGKLMINSDGIAVNGCVFPLTQITNIKLDISGWRSYQRSEDRSYPVNSMQVGDKNYLVVEAKNQEARCEFMLESFDHWKQLREHVIRWYYRRILIDESVRGNKSYGLEVLLYAQIQEFKKMISNPTER